MVVTGLNLSSPLSHDRFTTSDTRQSGPCQCWVVSDNQNPSRIVPLRIGSGQPVTGHGEER